MVHVVQRRRVAHAALQGVLDGGHRLPLRHPTVQTGAQADPRQAPPGAPMVTDARSRRSMSATYREAWPQTIRST